MPRKRSEKRTGQKKMAYVRRDERIKRLKKINQVIPQVAAVNFRKDALLAKYSILHGTEELQAQCLIDTGATISIINYNTWVKIGKPRLRTSGVGNILLGNNVQVQPEGVVSIFIRIGSYEYPINLVVMKGWRYEVILGLDFLVAIDAVIHVSKGEISVKRDKVVNTADTVVKHKARSSYRLIAKQDVVVRPGHEARIVADIDSAPPEKIYLIRGKHIATGVYEVSPIHELVVFYRAGTTLHVIKRGDILGKAEPIPESVQKNIYGRVNTVAQDDDTSTDSEAAEEKSTGEKKIKQVSEEELRESLKKLKVGNLNKKKFFHIFKKYAYAFDGKDPGLKELRRRRRGKKFWKSPESKGRIFTPSDLYPIYIPQFRQSPFHLQEAERMTAEWLDRELVRHSFSSWNSPVLMIPKPKGGLRMCVDYRQLNAESETDSYPMPRIDEILVRQSSLARLT